MFQEKRLINNRETPSENTSNESLSRSERRLQRIEERREARENRRERAPRRNRELTELRTQVEQEQETQQTVAETQTQIRDIEAPQIIPLVRASSRPTIRAQETPPTIPNDNPRSELIREYRLKVEEHMGGFLGGIFNFFGVSSEQVAIQLAANGENIENIGFFTVLITSAKVGFNRAFKPQDLAEVSDISLEPNGDRIIYREMAEDEWTKLTDDPEDHEFQESYTNFSATDELNIATTHEIFIPAGTKITNLTRDLIVTKVSDNTKTRIRHGEEWTAPAGGVVIRDTISTDTDESYQNKITSGTKFIGPITYRPINNSIAAPNNLSLERENLLNTFIDEQLEYRELHADEFTIVNGATKKNLNFNLNVNFNESGNFITRMFNANNGYAAIFAAVSNYVTNAQATTFGLTTEQFSPSVKQLLIKEICATVASQHLPESNLNTGTRNIRVSLSKNTLTSRSERKLIYSNSPTTTAP